MSEKRRKRQYCEKPACSRYGFVKKTNITPTKTLRLCPFCRAILHDRIKRKKYREELKKQGWKGKLRGLYLGCTYFITDNINRARDVGNFIGRSSYGRTDKVFLRSDDGTIENCVNLWRPWYGIEDEMRERESGI